MKSEPIQVNGSDVVYVHSSVYGKDTVHSKFPNSIDGLKLGHRRIIWMLRKFADAVRSPNLINTTRDIHFHGDSSIYETIGRLGQEFNYNPPLIEFTSKYGNYSRQRPPSSRYTYLKMAEVTKDLFYNNIDIRSLPKQLSEDMAELEPVVLIPAIPTSLVYYNDTIGFGFNSVSVPMNFSNVCDIACEYIKYKKTGELHPFEYAGLIEKMLPDMPVKNTLVNIDELKKAYSKGDFSKQIRLSGYVELFPNSISIQSLPFSIDVQAALKLLQTRISNKKENRSKKDLFLDKCIIKVEDASQEVNVADLRILLKKGSDVFEVWDKIKEYVPFTANISVNQNYYHNGAIVNMTPINLLECWYRARYDCVVSSKKHRLASLSQELRNIEARILVCDNRDEVIQIITNSASSEDGCRNLYDRFEITYNQASYIIETRMGVLVKLAKEELLPRYEQVMKQFNELMESLANVDDEMISYIQILKKKYAVKRKTKLPNYVGYMQFNKTGIIQLEDFKEIEFYKNLIPKATLEIHKYAGTQTILANTNNKLTMNNDIERVCSGTMYDIPSQEPYTVSLSSDKTACVVKGFVAKGGEEDRLHYVGKRCKIILRNGTIKEVDVTEEFSYRKSICRGAATDAVYAFPEKTKDCYLAIMNTDTPNVIIIQKLTPTSKNIVLNPSGEVAFQHFYHKDDIFINIDPKFLNRNSTNGFRIKDITELMKDKNQIHIDVNSSRWKNNKHLDLY